MESHRWLFIPQCKENDSFKDIPLLYPTRNVARQYGIEHFWLNPKPLHEAIGITKLEENVQEKVKEYVV